MGTALDAACVADTHAAVPVVAGLVALLMIVLPGEAYEPPNVSEQVRVNVSLPVHTNVTPRQSRSENAAPAAMGAMSKARPSPAIAAMSVPSLRGVNAVSDVARAG